MFFWLPEQTCQKILRKWVVLTVPSTDRRSSPKLSRIECLKRLHLQSRIPYIRLKQINFRRKSLSGMQGTTLVIIRNSYRRTTWFLSGQKGAAHLKGPSVGTVVHARSEIGYTLSTLIFAEPSFLPCLLVISDKLLLTECHKNSSVLGPGRFNLALFYRFILLLKFIRPISLCLFCMVIS